MPALGTTAAPPCVASLRHHVLLSDNDVPTLASRVFGLLRQWWLRHSHCAGVGTGGARADVRAATVTARLTRYDIEEVHLQSTKSECDNDC